MAIIRFDPEDPPEQPPAGCVDPLLWRVAHALHLEHRPEPDNRCNCGEVFPCTRACLAARGLLTACTRRSIDSAPLRVNHARRWSHRSI
jgi:hypothetical protein